MKLPFYKQFIIIVLLFSIAFNADLSRMAQAADETVDTTGVAAENEDTTSQDVINAQPSFDQYDDVNYSEEAPEFTDNTDDQAAVPASMSSFQALADTTTAITADSVNIFNLSTALGLDSAGVTRITMPVSDLTKIKDIYYMAKVLPDYANDFTSLYRDLPKPSKDKVDQALAAEALKTMPLFNSPEMYFAYLKDGGDTVSASDMTANIAIFDDFVKSAEDRLDSEKIKQIWTKIASDILAGNEITADISIISRITGLTVADISTRLQSKNVDDRSIVSSKITDFLDTSIVDIRIVKTLVYLVTPKSEGGAGHWKITVSRIFQTSKTSNESQPETAVLATNTTDNSVTCPEGSTAADCGYLQTSRPTAEVEDANGQQYEAYIQDLTQQEDQSYASNATVAQATAEAKKPTSVHAGGQAVDISQIDDIRCTLIQKKRVGADKISAEPIQPIKLAWQTNEGYTASGGNSGSDVMGMMTSVASDTLKSFLTSFNGDLSSYDGDLSRASFDDILKILGESMVGYAVSGNSNISLSGYNTTDTLKNLGGMYLADYMGLPREIFMGDNTLLDGKNDIENVKYLIGRTAIEQRLGLPFGSLDNSITVNGVLEHNLEGLLTNLGRRKLESEMNLDSGALKDIDTQMPMDFAVGKSIIEKELNLRAGTWPLKAATSFADLKSSLPLLRSQLIQQDPGYIDGLLRLPSGTTQALIDGKIKTGDVTTPFNSYDYTRKVGKIRMDDTVTGLTYFASYNNAYQLPAGTWEKTIAGDTKGYETIGIYTLARLLGDDSMDPSTKIMPAGVSADSITWTEDGVPYTYGTDKKLGSDQFGQLAFRTWLRQNLDPARTKDDACKTNHTDSLLDVTVSNNSGRTTAQSMDVIQAQVCPLDVVVPYTLNYKVSGAVATLPTTMVVDIPQVKAKAVGLDNLDLYRIMGYSSADGNSVMSRIGSKILYYALANKALGGADKLGIDLKDVNPVIQTDSKDVNFYVSRIFTAVDLSDKIKTDWSIIGKDSTQAKTIADKIDDIIARVGTTFSDGETDLSKFQKIAGIARDVSSLVDELLPMVNDLKVYYGTLKDSNSQTKVGQINGMIIHINALKHCIDEMIAGKEIAQVDDIPLNQIQISIPASTNLTDSGSDRRANNRMSPWKMASLLFSFLSGEITITEMFISIGSGVAESNLGLPANSLFYLVQNYEQRGLETMDGFYEAIGQARIEEQFNMPAFYFQGFSLDSKVPKFASNNKLLKQWLPDSADAGARNYAAIKKLSDTDFDQYLTILLFPNMPISTGLNTNYQASAGQSAAQSPARNFTYSQMIWDAEANWQTTRTKELAANGRSVIGEKTVDDVTRNISERGYGDGLRSSQDDLLFKMGLPTGIYDSLTTGGSSSWGKYTATAANIDKTFDIPTGSTESLFTGEKGLYTTSVTNSEKNQVEASSLNIGTNFLEKYIQLLNGEILPSEMDLYAYGQTPDYIINNPYAKAPDATATCPILYTVQGSFQVNNSPQYLENDSFCYYDQKGRHCFQSSDEAQRYANSNDADSLKHMHLEDTNGDGKIDNNDAEVGNDILGYMAMKLTVAYNDSLQNLGAGVDAFGRTATDAGGNSLGKTLQLDYVEIYNGLLKFVNDKSAVTIFDDIKVGNTKMNSGIAFGLISQQTGLTTDLLTRLFSRTTIDAPVANYKRLVGREEAQKIITAKLFNVGANEDLGIGPFDAKMFDPGDLYDILHGDFSSVYRIGAKIVDDQMELKPGTTALIGAAVSPNALNCAMAQAGGQFFGSLFGLSYIPLNGINGTTDMLANIGEAKVEETLSLPKGSFRGSTISALAESVGAINFAVAFKVPQKNLLTYDDLYPILGASRASPLINSSDLDKLKAVQKFLISAPVLSNVAYAGLRALEAKVMDNVSYIIQKLSSANPADLQNSIGANSSKNEIMWHNDVSSFVNLLWDLDSRFEISNGSTFKLFSNQLDGTALVTPTEYIRRVADKAVTRAGAMGLGRALGLDSTQSEGAANLLMNFQIIFFCNSPDDDPNAKSHQLQADGTCNIRSVNDSGLGWTTVTHDPETMYHNWGYLYDNLDKIFNFKLDDRAGVPQGTIGQLIREPQNAFKIVIKIGATKLDDKFGLDSTKIGSFSGLFSYLYPADIAAVTPPVSPDDGTDLLQNQGISNLEDAINQKQIELAGYQDAYNPRFGDLIPLADKLKLDKDKETQLLVGIENILMSVDTTAAKINAFTDNASANIPDLNTDGTKQGIVAQMSTMFEALIPLGVPVSRCLAELTTLQGQLTDLETQIKARNATQAQATITIHDAAAVNLQKDNKDIPSDVRKVANKILAWAIDAAAEYVHNKILNVTWNGQNIGIDMPMADIKLIFSDIHYIAVAGMALSANLVQVQIDRIGTTNCNPSEISDGKCPMAVPAGFRLTYEDFREAYFGIPAFDADKLAAFVYVTGNTPNPATSPYNFSNASAPDSGSGAFSSGVDYMGTVTPGDQNTTASLTSNMQKNYDYSPAVFDAEVARNQGIVDNIKLQTGGQCVQQTGATSGSAYDQCFSTLIARDPGYQPALNNIDILNNPQNHPSEIAGNKAVIQASAKTSAWENLQFKLMDIGLWKLDDNVFPGFGQAIMRGNADIRVAALTKYFENGLVNGHLFGIRFGGLSTGGVLIAAFALQFFDHKFRQNDPVALKNSFIDFAKGAGLNYMTDWVVKNSEDWFGFKMPPDIFKGIMVGLCTGQWGFSSISVEDITGTSSAKTTDIGGVQLPTLGSALVGFATNWVFNWADKTFKWKVGTAYTIFKNSWELYKNIKLITTLSHIKTLANFNSAPPEVQKLMPKITSTSSDADVANSANAAMAAPYAVIVKIITYFLSPAVERTIHGEFDADFRQFESDHGLVAGSLDILVNGIIDFIVGVVVLYVVEFIAFLIGGPVLAGAIGALVMPAMLFALLMAFVLFIIVNIFGVYEVDYYCDADGYYPYIDSVSTTHSSGFLGVNHQYNETVTPNYVVKDNDVSGMGVWGGKVSGQEKQIQDLLQQKSIEAAQYKAKTLIGDLLNMQNFTKYNDSSNEPTVPIQIMTGRQYDVDYWDGKITTNMCVARLGEGYMSVNGICSRVNARGEATDKTRMGVWFNLQNVAFTHIGF
jgi:hypothetical protein